MRGEAGSEVGRAIAGAIRALRAKVGDDAAHVAVVVPSRVNGTLARRELHGRLEGGRTLMAVARMSLAAAALGGVSYVTWWGLDSVLGRSILAQVLSVSAAAIAGFVVYAVLVLAMRIPEARRIELAGAGRLRRRA